MVFPEHTLYVYVKFFFFYLFIATLLPQHPPRKWHETTRYGIYFMPGVRPLASASAVCSGTPYRNIKVLIPCIVGHLPFNITTIPTDFVVNVLKI
jgi:hypothetical protein